MEAELSTHLGYKKHEQKPEGVVNSRNGYSQRSIQGDFGIAEIAFPRDRQGEFEPQMVKKGQNRLVHIYLMLQSEMETSPSRKSLPLLDF